MSVGVRNATIFRGEEVMDKSKLLEEISNIREQYFEYPTKSVRPDEAVARQNIHYLLGVIDALLREIKP